MHSSHRRGPVVSDLGVLPSRNGCRWAVQGRSPTPLLPTPPPPWVCWLFSPLRFEQHWLLKLFYFIDQKPLNFSQPKPEPGPNFSACWNGLHSVPSAGSERFLLHRCVCVCNCWWRLCWCVLDRWWSLVTMRRKGSTEMESLGSCCFQCPLMGISSLGAPHTYYGCWNGSFGVEWSYWNHCALNHYVYILFVFLVRSFHSGKYFFWVCHQFWCDTNTCLGG